MLLKVLLLLPSAIRLSCVRAAEHSEQYDGTFPVTGLDQELLANLCPDYTRYALHLHKPYSDGPLQLPFQRPHRACRKFTSDSVEKVIDDLYPQFKDRDLAQIFRNAFPNTLDTTVRWHVDGVKQHAPISSLIRDRGRWKGAHSFIVTGDINAEWLRDSTNQLSQYQALAATSPELASLILGAINTQTEFVIQSPYCNAFQPPSPSNLAPVQTGQEDYVHPTYEPSVVFECKYEIDSLANFLSLANQYHASTKRTDFITDRWFKAVQTLLSVLYAQSQPTFDDETHKYTRNEYTFVRHTRSGTETLNLAGIGNPLANGTGLVRSAFRPSDDATTFGFFIPGNAMMSVELARTATILSNFAEVQEEQMKQAIIKFATEMQHLSDTIRKGIYDHAVLTHPKFGKVFAFETDGYGSALFMDDANIPSLLSLPLLGFVNASDEIYQNTRKMILSTEGNPYFLKGPKFEGIGGPHQGVRNAWPMSVLVQAMTSNDDAEILQGLERVKNVSVFGLINESVDVERGVSARGGGDGMTRSWFAWANSVFAQTILHLVAEKPELLLKEGNGKYVVGKGFV